MKQHADMIKRRVKPIIVLIAIPVFFSMLFATCFGQVFVDDIPIVLCDQDGSQASRDMASRLESGGGLRITLTTDSTAQMKESMLLGETMGAVIFPEGFGEDLSNSKSVQAMCLINGNNFMISNNAMLYMTNTFNAVNKELRIALLEEGSIVPYAAEQMSATLSFTDRVLFNPQMSYLTFIIFGIVGIVIQQSNLTMMSAQLVYTKERLLLESRVMSASEGKMERSRIYRNLAKTAVIYALCSLVGLFSALLCLRGFFQIPMQASALEILLLAVVFLFDIAAVALVISSLFREEAHCVQFDMFLAIPTMLTCSYAWPEFMMPSLFAPLMKMVWPLYYFSVPLRDLLLKGAEFAVIKPYLIGGVIFATVWLPVGGWLYVRSLSRCQKIQAEANGKE